MKNVKFYIIIIIFVGVIALFLQFVRSNNENFTVDFIPYANPYFGFCYPKLTAEQWKSGNFDTHCWNNFAYEDCELLNQNGYNCGFDLKTGKKLKCHHNTGKCKDEPQCFSSCYQQVGRCKEPYMIPVTRDDLIGLGAA